MILQTNACQKGKVQNFLKPGSNVSAVYGQRLDNLLNILLQSIHFSLAGGRPCELLPSLGIRRRRRHR